MEFDLSSTDIGHDSISNSARVSVNPQQQPQQIKGGNKLWSSLAQIYDGPADPFANFPPHDTDASIMYKRYDEIEARIHKNSRNTGRFLMEEYQYQPQPN